MPRGVPRVAQFVLCCWSVCTVTQEQVSTFLMFLYDADHSGTIGFEELGTMLSDMMNKRADSRSKAHNKRMSEHTKHEVEKILQALKANMQQSAPGEEKERALEDYQLHLKQFDELISLHFDLFAPLYDTQRQLRAKVMGLDFWRRQIRHRQQHKLHKLIEKMPNYITAMKLRDEAAQEHRLRQMQAPDPSQPPKKFNLRSAILGNAPRLDLSQLENELFDGPTAPVPARHATAGGLWAKNKVFPSLSQRTRQCGVSNQERPGSPLVGSSEGQ